MNNDFIALDLEEGEEEDLCEFGIEHAACPFCEQPRTILFDEHYYFCPNCTAIYTFMIVKETSCEHIKEDTPTIIRRPNVCFESPAIIWVDNGDDVNMVCDDCGAECIADGW